MKRFRRIARILAVAAAMAASAASAAGARAQTVGVGSAGMAAGFATYNDGGFINAFLQCDVVPHVRVVPQLGYMFRNQGKNGVAVSVDAHFPFRIVHRVNVYPLVGATYNYWHHKPSNSSINRVGVNIGAGLDVGLAPNIKLVLEGKGTLIDDAGSGYFYVGIGYMF